MAAILALRFGKSSLFSLNHLSNLPCRPSLNRVPRDTFVMPMAFSPLKKERERLEVTEMSREVESNLGFTCDRLLGYHLFRSGRIFEKMDHRRLLLVRTSTRVVSFLPFNYC